MPCCWMADKFLELVNDIVCWEDGKIRVRTDEERSQQFPLNTVKSFVFTKEVNVVIEGFCSWEEGDDHIGWLRTVLEGMKLKHVLMFATCCGSYSDEFQDTLRTFFPEIVWLFPDMYDLYGNFGSDSRTLTAAQCLMKAGVMGPSGGA